MFDGVLKVFKNNIENMASQIEENLTAKEIRKKKSKEKSKKKKI